MNSVPLPPRMISFLAAFLGLTVWLPAQSPEPSASPAPVAPATGEIPHRLVSVNTIYPALLQEIRYATPYNFTGKTLYPAPVLFVHEEAAKALQRVQEELANEGLGLKIYDAYRPLSVQAAMWKLVPDERYVSNPAKNKGKHTRGTAVDVTLVDRLGKELKMPTDYDDFSEKAHRQSRAWTEEERANSQKLEEVMKKHGFLPFSFEWWHFDYVDWEKYPPLDIRIEDLQRGVKTTVPVD